MKYLKQNLSLFLFFIIFLGLILLLVVPDSAPNIPADAIKI